MLEQFTDRARKVMALANQEAQNMQHFYIGTEHILLGLVGEGSGVGANVLKNLGVDLRKVRQEVERLLKKGEAATVGKLPQTPRAKSVIEFAIAEAQKLNHNYVGTEHLLLGLLRERPGVAAHVLMNLGISLDEAREEVAVMLGLPFDLKPEPQVDHLNLAAQRAADKKPESDLQSLAKQCLRFDARLKELTAEKDEAVRDGVYEKAADLREEAVFLAREKTQAIRGIVERETALAALVNDAVRRLPDEPVTAGKMILALIDTHRKLARRLEPLMEQIRTACDES